MKTAMYREYLCLRQDKSLKDIIKGVAIFLILIVVLTAFTKSSVALPFSIAFNLGMLSNLFTRDFDDGSIATLRTMPINPKNYVIARYITAFLTFALITLVILLTEHVVGLFIDVDPLDISERVIMYVVPLFLVVALIPGYYGFGPKGVGLMIYIIITTILIFAILSPIMFYNFEKYEYLPTYKIIILIVLFIVALFVSVSVSINTFKTKDF
ncbi:ABC-2 transporter permease [Peptoniphilus sp.]|uniref:ABC-2 transporter permease n=1 Tax=Peptoniphilus sp. TaxID=1971214 RepID=UPI003D902AB5